MRFAAVTLCWLLATAALAAAIPAVWMQRNVVDADGYARLAYRAAATPALQSGVADQLTVQAMRLFREHRFEMAPAAVQAVAADYTTGPSFPAQFAEANRNLHDWLLSGDDTDTWLVNVAPMLRDQAFAPLFSDYNVSVPATLAVPVTMPRADAVRPRADWVRWLAIGSALVAVGCAFLLVVVARRRGRAVAGLGVSALLVGAAGWAGIEVGRGRADAALNRATVDFRQIAGALLDSAEASLHHWLDGVLAGGAVLVGLGVVVAAVGTLFR